MGWLAIEKGYFLLLCFILAIPVLGTLSAVGYSIASRLVSRISGRKTAMSRAAGGIAVVAVLVGGLRLAMGF